MEMAASCAVPVRLTDADRHGGWLPVEMSPEGPMGGETDG